MTEYDEDVRSVTKWHRLSPSTRGGMTRGLRAELHDPLWLLGRQWQVGEFAGEDAGSPVKVELWYEHDPMGRVELAPDREATSPRDYDPHEDGPLEALVERETVTTPEGDEQPGREVAAEAGRYFRARLDEELSGGAPAPDTFDASLLLAPPEDETDTAGERYLSVMRGRSLDGYRLYERLTGGGNVAAAADWTGVDWGSVDVPYPGTGTLPDAYKRAAKAFVDWYADCYDEPADESERAWEADRMEYQFRASTGAGSTETVFLADEYAGGRLDRDDLLVETDPDASLGGGAGESDLPALDGMASSGEDAVVPGSLTRPGQGPPPDLAMMPSKVTYPGMPSPRWWEFEDGDVNLGNMTAGPGELGKLLVTEFATLYGNDWFSVPLEVPVGSMTRITEFLVTDTFGVVESVAPATEHTTASGDDPSHEVGDEAAEGPLGGVMEGSDGWNVFMHTDLPNHDRPGLLVPPVLATHHESDPVERVLLARDEMANMAFGIELVTEDAVGDPLRWRQYGRPTLAVDTVSPASDPDEEWVRLVNTGEASLDIAGWTVENDAGDVYTFGDSGDPIRVDAGETITLQTGQGTAVGDEYYWGRSEADGPVWEGADEVTVRDADGDVVANEFVGSPGDVDPGLPDYRLVTDVRDYWFPLRMRAAGDAADRDAEWEIGDLRFELSRLLDADPGLPEPDGEVLEPGLRLHDEELPRAGLEVRRSYQLARWLGGSTHLWSGRRAGFGRGEGSSGLRFDILEEPDVGAASGRREGGGG